MEINTKLKKKSQYVSVKAFLYFQPEISTLHP